MPNTNESKLSIAESAIADFINGKSNVGAMEAKLSSALSACNFFSRQNTFRIKVIKNSLQRQGTFFGIRVMPEISQIEKIANSAVTDLTPLKDLQTAWNSIDSWDIEIDSNLFDRSVINLNPREFVAGLLHEVGHTVYSDKVIERFYRAYRSMYVHMKSAEKETIRLGYALFTIPLAVSCGIRSWVRGRNGIREEYYADRIVKECGYGDSYVSLLSKIIEAFGTDEIGMTEEAADKSVESKTQWAAVNISDTVRRRNRLSRDLYLESASTTSQYLKNLYATVMNRVGINLRERYTGDAVESVTDIFEALNRDDVLTAFEADYHSDNFMHFSTAVESVLHTAHNTPGTLAFESYASRIIKKGLPSWIEIDRINIEVDKMRNHHDRAFVLDMIYSKINDINEFLEAAETDPVALRKYENEANQMLKTLDDLRNRVLMNRSFATTYRVFAKYPAGYEG